MARSVFITGCNRGLGLEMVKQLVTSAQKPHHIFATCRQLDKATELSKLAKDHSEIHLKALDATNEAAYPELVKWVVGIVGDEGLNLVINNAGIMKRDTLKSVTSEVLLEHFRIHTMAPLMITKAFHPLLKKAAAKTGGADGSLSSSKACVINISAHVASLKDLKMPMMYSYCISKTALNMASKNLSLELVKDGILTAMVHPGWVKTDMGGPGAPMDAPTSVKKILDTISSLKKEHNGAFLNYNGTPIPW